MRERGINDSNKILSLLNDMAAEDIDHRTGKIFGYAYGAGDAVSDLVEKAFVRYMGENALDPFAFPGTRTLEMEVIRDALGMLNAPDTAEGVFTTGGTESVLMAHRSARELFKDQGYKKVLIPITAHPASLKACDYLGLEAVVLPVDENFKLTKEIVKEHLTPDTIAVVASTPSYGTGVIDEIEGIGDLLFGTGVQFIIDACMGGMVLPFMNYKRLWDFQVPGVTAICVDFHKFGYSGKGSSAVLYRDGQKMKELQTYACSNWMGYTIVNPTMLNTKSGGPVASTWAVMQYLGRDGYTDIVSYVMDGVEKIKQGIGSIQGLEIIGNPEANLLSFSSSEVNIFDLADKMKERGWYLQNQFKFEYEGVVMPESIHLTIGYDNIKNVEQFLSELQECIDFLKENAHVRGLNHEMNEIPYQLRDNKIKQRILDQYAIHS